MQLFVGRIQSIRQGSARNINAGSSFLSSQSLLANGLGNRFAAHFGMQVHSNVVLSILRRSRYSEGNSTTTCLESTATQLLQFCGVQENLCILSQTQCRCVIEIISYESVSARNGLLQPNIQLYKYIIQLIYSCNDYS